MNASILLREQPGLHVSEVEEDLRKCQVCLYAIITQKTFNAKPHAASEICRIEGSVFREKDA